MSSENLPTRPGDLLAAADPARLFIIGGMLLVIAGMVFGDLFAVFVLHPNAANIGSELGAAAAAAASGDPEAVFGHFGLIGSLLENAGTKKDTHVHIIQVGYLAFIMAFLQPWVALGRRHKMLLARTFLWAAVVLPVSIFLIHYVGLVYSPLETIGWASIFADLAGLVLTLVLVAELIGMWRHFRGHGNGGGDASRFEDRDSRTLLAGGVVLVLAGFLFGAYYAGIHLQEHEQRELTLLGDLMSQASAGLSESSGQTLEAYGGLQAERAVMIAAHAHAIEFGLLALMLAIVQPYVFLSSVWRRRLVWMTLAGGVLLPVAVYSELSYGLLAMITADLAGLMVILAMSGMLFGVLRHTGKIDAGKEEAA